MWMEGQNRGLEVPVGGGRERAPQERLMTDVDAVKIADRQGAGFES